MSKRKRTGDFFVRLSAVNGRSFIKHGPFKAYETAAKLATVLNRELREQRGDPKVSPFPFWYVDARMIPTPASVLRMEREEREHEED